MVIPILVVPIPLGNKLVREEQLFLEKKESHLPKICCLCNTKLSGLAKSAPMSYINPSHVPRILFDFWMKKDFYVNNFHFFTIILEYMFHLKFPTFRVQHNPFPIRNYLNFFTNNILSQKNILDELKCWHKWVKGGTMRKIGGQSQPSLLRPLKCCQMWFLSVPQSTGCSCAAGQALHSDLCCTCQALSWFRNSRIILFFVLCHKVLRWEGEITICLEEKYFYYLFPSPET